MRTILFEKCTVQTLIMCNKSANYMKLNETISPIKSFIAFLNRNSSKNRRQNQNRESSMARAITLRKNMEKDVENNISPKMMGEHRLNSRFLVLCRKYFKFALIAR